MSEPFEAKDLVLVRRNKLVLGLASSPALAVVGAIVAAVAIKPAFLGFAFPFAMITMLTLGAAWLFNPFPTKERVALGADRAGVRTDKGLIVPSADLREGFVVPGRSGKPPYVHLTRRRGLPFYVSVHDEAEGTRLLRALGLDAAHRVVSWLGMSRVYASARNFFINTGLMLCGPFVFGVLGGTLRFPPLAVLAGLVFFGCYVSFFMPTRVQVGADGVIVSWYGRKRFIGYAEVELVSSYARPFGTSQIRGVSMVLRGGEEVRVPLGYGYWDSGRSGTVEERIREAMETFEKGGAVSHAAVLARGDLSVRDWILALRQVGSGASAGPRTAAVAGDTLWRIVEDASSEPTARAAAAVALGPGLDDDGRARMESIARGTAAPKLRIAIEAAATATDDDALEGALAEVEEADSEARDARA